MMRAATSFHDHTGGLQLGKELNELRPGELLAMNLAGITIDPVELHHVLGRIDGIRRSIHLGTSAAVVGRNLHFGT